MKAAPLVTGNRKTTREEIEWLRERLREVEFERLRLRRTLNSLAIGALEITYADRDQILAWVVQGAADHLRHEQDDIRMRESAL